MTGEHIVYITNETIDKMSIVQTNRVLLMKMINIDTMM